MKLFGDSIEIQIECSASMANLASIGKYINKNKVNILYDII